MAKEQLSFHDDEGPFVTFQVPGRDEREACFDGGVTDQTTTSPRSFDRDDVV